MRLWSGHALTPSKRRFAAITVLFVYLSSTASVLLSYLPGWYHPGAQRITFLRAVEIFNEGPFPAIFGHPFSGANVYALLGSIPLTLGLNLRFVRLPMVVLGIVSVLLVIGIAGWYEPDGQPPLGTVGLLLVTPHFVVFSGFALSMIVTLTAGLFGVYGYLRYLETERRVWLVLSAVGGGLAALNHFWGGVVFVTILGFDLIVVGRLAQLRQWERVSTTVRRRFTLWAAHVAALVPAIALYGFYRLSGSSGRYGKYTISDSAGLLVRPTWYKTLGFYTIQYHPAHLLVTALLVGLCWYLVRTRDLSVLTTERYEKLVVSPLAFWGLWVVLGGTVLFLFPRGSYVHEYYFWWSIPPSVGLVAWWTHSAALGLPDSVPRANWPSRTRVRRSLFAGLLLTSAVLTGLHAMRGYVGPQEDVPGFTDGVPPHCLVRDCSDPPSNEHVRVVTQTVRPTLTDEEVVGYGGVDPLLGARLLLHERYRHVPYGDPIPPDTALVVAADPLPANRSAGWEQAKTIVGGDETTYLYRSS